MSSPGAAAIVLNSDNELFSVARRNQLAHANDDRPGSSWRGLMLGPTKGARSATKVPAGRAGAPFSLRPSPTRV